MGYSKSSDTKYWDEYYKSLISNEPTYNESAAVIDAKNKLTEYENNKPGAYSGTYTQQLNNSINKYVNRNPFSYNANNDSTYQQLRDEYLSNGKTAMQDTVGNIMANNGGYGSSYAQVAGQQTYNKYASELADKIPVLKNQAYTQYQNEGNELVNQIGVLQNLDTAEYGRYRDNVSDYYNFLNYYNTKYQNEASLDMQKFTNEWNSWNTKTSQAQSNYQYNNSNDISNYQYDTTLAENKRQYDTTLNYQKEQAANELALSYAQLAKSSSSSSSSGSNSSSSSKKSTTATVSGKETDNGKKYMGYVLPESTFNSDNISKKLYGDYESYVEKSVAGWLDKGKITRQEAVWILEEKGFTVE